MPEPIFTPATKAQEGHDENISFVQAVEIEGREVTEKVRDLSLQIYTEARNYARERGIIIADTKFEFGKLDGELILIDEVLTPFRSDVFLIVSRDELAEEVLQTFNKTNGTRL